MLVNRAHNGQMINVVSSECMFSSHGGHENSTANVSFGDIYDFVQSFVRAYLSHLYMTGVNAA